MIRFFKTKRFYLALGIGVLAICAGMPEAQALRVGMKRIVFEGPKRAESLTIINDSSSDQTYRIGWQRFRMTDDTALQHIPEGQDGKVEGKPDILWAEDMIRYAPRRVTVPAGTSQSVRLMFRQPKDLADGEYRAHLWILTEEAVTAPQPVDAAKGEGKQAIQLKMKPGVTLPIIVRHGKLNATAAIDKVTLSRSADNKIAAKIIVTRGGNRSLYGDIRFICTGGGAAMEAHKVRGLAVYPEVMQRNFTFEFALPANNNGVCSAMRVEYIADPDDAQFKGKIMAQADAILP